MRIIAKRTLREFWEKHPEAEQPLKAWHQQVKGADWATPADVKSAYRTADFLKGNRVCFNIGGNKYHLIVQINYPRRVVFIRFVGIHAEYDKIDANSV